MKYHFKIYNNNDGLWAEGLELFDCASEGKNIEELKINLTEALNGVLDEPAGSNMVFPLPDPSFEGEDDVIEISVEPTIAFSLLVRQARISHRMSQSQVQKAMGFKSRNSYVRLERRANPSLEIIARVKKVFPEINLEECIVN